MLSTTETLQNCAKPFKLDVELMYELTYKNSMNQFGWNVVLPVLYFN